MSYYSSETEYAWDDVYINIDSIESEEEDLANRKKEEQKKIVLNSELNEIGDIKLLSGRSIGARTICNQVITPAEWRWATHKADQALHRLERWDEIERPFLKKLLTMGKSYAIGRYAKWERIPYTSALVATLPHGLRALLEQYLIGEKILLDIDERKFLGDAMRLIEKDSSVIAYERAGMIRSAIYQIAEGRIPFGEPDDEHNGSRALSREATRIILSLSRLHFSVSEINIGSFREMQALGLMYEASRPDADRIDFHDEARGRYVRNWDLRHRHPLTYLFPSGIRDAIDRGVQHPLACGIPDRTTAVNEIALAHCELLLVSRRRKRSLT